MNKYTILRGKEINKIRYVFHYQTLFNFYGFIRNIMQTCCSLTQIAQ